MLLLRLLVFKRFKSFMVLQSDYFLYKKQILKLMEPDTVQCTKCNNYIMTKVKGIHDVMCQPQIPKKKVQQQSGLLEKAKNFFFYQQKIQKQPEEDMIPCTQCGESFPFYIYAQHELNCVGRQMKQCNLCGLVYPIYVFDEHYKLCSQGKTIVHKQKPRIQIEQKPILQEEMLHFQQEEELQQQMQRQLNHLIGNLAVKESRKQEDEKPLTKQQIKKIPREKLNYSQQCPICCVIIKKNGKTMLLKCVHKFHEKCIEAWLLKNPCCPMCRHHAIH